MPPAGDIHKQGPVFLVPAFPEHTTAPILTHHEQKTSDSIIYM